jgi:hypothetical protein
MTEIDLSCAVWRKSSRTHQNGNCVEAATNLHGVVAVRDSKDPDGPKLLLACPAWTAFLQGIKDG